jgi:hypothetical protein
MPKIYAAFKDAEQAESAAGALLDHGLKPESISLIVNDESRQRLEEEQLNYSAPQTVMQERYRVTAIDEPLGNQKRHPGSNIEGGDISESDLNPAQNDYPMPEGPAGPESFSSAPGGALRDYNAGLEGDDYNRTYEADVDRENRKEFERTRGNADELSTPAPPTDEGFGAERKERAEIERDAEIRPAAYDAERAAKRGITTTTPEDSASGAKKGAAIGLGVGALAAAIAIFVPGVGLVIGGGALATAAAGIAASSGAGALAGGVFGYLKDQGIEEEDMPHFQEAYDSGGAILEITAESDEDLDRRQIEGILAKYGAARVANHGYMA